MYVGQCVNVKIKTAILRFYNFLIHIPHLCVLLYNKQLKRLEVLIRFLRFPECPFLLHGVKQRVASLSQVLVSGTDDRQLSVIFFMCTYRIMCNLCYVHLKKNLFNTNDIVPFLHVLTGSQININLNIV